MRTCNGCKQEKPLTEFYLGTARNGRKYPQSRCKACVIKSAKRSNQRTRLKRYGLTIEQRDSMALAAEGKCAICEQEMKLVVDHDHLTGKARGMLCSACNSGIGMLKDDIRLLQAAILYLQRTNTSEA